MHYTKVKPLIEQCGVVWEEGKNIQVGKKELSMFADLLVKEKELTDEEIIEIGLKLRIATTEIDGNWSPVVLEFARAILRKAQEK